MTEPLTLSQAEAEELHRFTRNDYISPNSYPALLKLLARIERALAVGRTV